MAQSGGALLLPEFPNRDELLMLFTGIDSAKFRRPVVPGDQVRIEVTILNWRRLAVKLQGVATVDGKVVCEAQLMCMLVDNPTSGAKKLQAAPKTEAKPAEPVAAPVPEAVLS
jgi:3-hydroxyacyl-[acyl-carrier-protein] dehydratase